MYALSKMGTIEIVDSIASSFISSSLDFKLFACSVLGDIKLQRSEEVLLDLLDKESDITIITYIAYSLCKLLSCRAIPELQKLLPDAYDTSVFNLEELLYINATMNGLDMPEIQEWKAIVDEDEAMDNKMSLQFAGKVGRNDPCPCGSGIKYKKCCGKNA
jgi:HEAT repeat protein